MQSWPKLLASGLLITAVSGVCAAHAGHPSTVRLVSRIVGKEFLSETIRIGDLNGAGAPDVLFVQNLYGPRIITRLTARAQSWMCSRSRLPR